MWRCVVFARTFWVNQFIPGIPKGRQGNTWKIQKALRFQYKIRINAPKKMRYQAKGTKDLRDT